MCVGRGYVPTYRGTNREAFCAEEKRRRFPVSHNEHVLPTMGCRKRKEEGLRADTCVRMYSTYVHGTCAGPLRKLPAPFYTTILHLYMYAYILHYIACLALLDIIDIGHETLRPSVLSFTGVIVPSLPYLYHTPTPKQMTAGNGQREMGPGAEDQPTLFPLAGTLPTGRGLPR